MAVLPDDPDTLRARLERTNQFCQPGASGGYPGSPDRTPRGLRGGCPQT